MDIYVLKYGSFVLTKDDGNLNEEVITNIASDTSALIKTGKFPVIVSSGAVSSGRKHKMLKGNFKVNSSDLDKKLLREQILSSIGQANLITKYENELLKFGHICSQHLVTRSNFASRKMYKYMKAVVLNILSLGIVPIFNENDFLSPEELDFSDNDQLACMLAAMLNAKLLIINTNVPGVYDRDPEDPKAKVIPIIENPSEIKKNLSFGKNKLGRGGMDSKLLAAELITSLGIPMVIANGFEKDIVSKIVLKKEKVGTLFPVQTDKPSDFKTWLTTSAVGKGKIIVSTYLADRLKKKSVCSILLAGVENIEGGFEKDDVVNIYDEDDNLLCLGKTKYSSNELRKIAREYKKDQTVSKKSKKIVVHYDYLAFKS